MLGRRANKPGGGVAEPGKIIAFDRVGHTETTMPSRLFAPPPKLFLATSAADDDDDRDEAAVPERVEAVTSPNSIMQAGSLASPAVARHTLNSGPPAPCSRRGSSGGGGGGRRYEENSRRRRWDARPVGLGLADALNGAETATVLTAVTGRTLCPVRTIDAPSSCSHSPPPASKELVGVNSLRRNPVGQSLASRCLSPGDMEASEDYTRVIARGPNNPPRTVHIFDDDDRVDVGAAGGLPAVGGEAGFFLRWWCHGCGMDLGQGKDIFMYRGKMAFCSHECRYRKMLLDEKL